MKVLVVNCGSSSVKFQLLEMASETALARGLADRVGIAGGAEAELTYERNSLAPLRIAHPLPDHLSALSLIAGTLTHPESGVVASLDDIGAVGHRVVHGGEHFWASVIINEAVLAAVRECIELAPLHNPANLQGVEACRQLLPSVPHVAVFDTAFHQTMPRQAYLYGIPYELYQQRRLRRYGFHGTSHRYVTQVATQLLQDRGVPPAQQAIVTCHLGNGCSMAAVRGGASIDTSMGLTPLEGLIMGTRCGDVDPAIVWYIQESLGIDTDAIDVMLNQQSGLLGVSGVSSDMRDVLAAAHEGNERARAAIELYCYRVRKYIGAYAAVMGCLHAVVFTAGVGENAPAIRSRCCEELELLGIEIAPARNEAAVGPHQPVDIAADAAPARVFVIPTNEELMIARDTVALTAN